MVKKSISLILMMLIVFCTAVFAAGLIGDTAQLSFTLISQNPDPVSPGEIADLRWTIENLGGDAAGDVQVELVDNYPFSLYSGDKIKNIGLIQGRQTGEKAVIVLYKVKVDEDAVEGTNEIKLRYKTSQTGWVELDPFDINIQTSDATLSIEKIELSPEIVAPGEPLNIKITTKNLADSFLKDVSIKLDLTSASTPFAPLDSATEKRIKQISAGAHGVLSYDLIVEPDAALGVYKIPVDISFNDNLGNSFERSDLLGIVVGAAPDIRYYVDSSGVKTAGASGTVTIKFVNKGLSNIKFLNIKLKEGDNYDITSPEEVYIGNIDSDDYETADFDLFVSSKAPDRLSLPLEIVYKDANNKDYRIDSEVILKLYSKGEAERLGVQQKGSSAGIVISLVIVAVAIVIYIVYRKRKKKKKE